MRLGSRNRRQGNRRNRQMFFEAPEVEPVFFDESGLLKLIFRQDDMRLLGVHVGGEQATELVHLGLIAMMAEAGADLFNRTCFNYPTLGDLSIIDNGDAWLVRLRELLGIRRRLDFSDSIDWVDPVIGLRGRVKIWKATKIFAEGDVGGFNANADTAFELRREGRTIMRESVDSTDWSYQLAGGLEFQLTRNIWTQVGWRYMKYDFRKNGFTDKNELNGPFLQT